MKNYTDEKSIETFCRNNKRIVDNMIWQSIQENIQNLKVGWQRIYSLFKMNRKDNAIYLMFVNVNRKDESNVHCDIVSITRYENASEYNQHVEVAQNH